VGALAALGQDAGAVALVPAGLGAVFILAAVSGNSKVNDCRAAMDAYDAGAVPLPPTGREARGPSIGPPGLAPGAPLARPPASRPVIGPRPAPVIAPPPAGAPPVTEPQSPAPAPAVGAPPSPVPTPPPASTPPGAPPVKPAPSPAPVKAAPSQAPARPAPSPSPPAPDPWAEFWKELP
jgi:hypothetical protein